MKAFTKKSLKILASRIGWFIGLAFVIYLMRRHPLVMALNARDLSVSAIALLALFTVLANLCQGIRYYFLWPDGKIPFWNAAFLPFCVHSANILLPFRGGETLQPLFVRKWDPTQKIAPLIYWLFIDKVVEFFAMLPLLALTAWYFDYNFHKTLALAILSWPLMFLYLARSKRPPRNFFVAYIFALLSWVFNVLAYLPVVASFKTSAGIVVATSFGSSIPALPASVGTYEYVFVWVCERAGFMGNHILMLAIATHAITVVATIAIGLVLGIFWGWPSRTEHVEAQAQRTPKKHRISNAIVFVFGALTLIFSGVLWVNPLRRSPKGATSP